MSIQQFNQNQIIGSHIELLNVSAVMADNTIDNNFDLSTYIRNRISVLFFYPLDFTFVCPSELIALDAKMPEFEKRGVAVASVSIDSQYAHLAYKNTGRDQGGIGKVRFPMIADINKTLASRFHVLHQNGVALRATIITDKNGIVRHYSVNDLAIGRNIDEIIRVVDAIEHHATHGEVCPANWVQGKSAIKPTQEGIKDYLNKNLKENA
jgi:peroxiredoxin (alkyl hydroperoxide reductase subunit C)